MTVVHMIGNAHIDPVWLWGWQAGVDEMLATVSAALDRCDEYPDFIFTRGEALVYQRVERLRPDLFARIGPLIRDGRWFVAGGTTLQPDLNLPTEMALRRQIRHGQAYFNSRFGVQPRIGFNPDSFGHPAYLPDLLVEHGYAGYVFGRPEPRQMDIPFAAFRWRGAGGCEIPAFRVIGGYAFFAAELREHIQTAIDNADPALGHTMCFYGVGDHGGGPTKAQIEWIREHQRAFDGIELRFSTPAAFFDAIAGQHDSLPLIEGELQHVFPGCYSVMSDIKRAQRHGEHLLDQAERVATICSADDVERGRYLGRIETAWDDLLFTAFHDIVTGTSTPHAWASCRAMQGRARIAAEEVIVEASRIWSHRVMAKANQHQIVILNTDDAAFAGVAECETWLDYDTWQNRWLSTPEGIPIVFQQVQPQAMHLVPRLVFPVEIAAQSSMRVQVRTGPAPASASPSSDLQVSPRRIANGHIDVSLGPAGIVAIMANGRKLLGGEGISLQLRCDHTDTWTANTDRWSEAVSAILAGGNWIVEEAGPLRARVRMENRLGTSRLRWTLSLLRDDPRLSMQLEVNFDERFSLLQLAINLGSTPQGRVDSVGGATVARGLSPVEWPVQGWSRLRFDGIDMAVVTQDAFSLSADETHWRWTLMRSPRMAWAGGKPPIYRGHDYFTDQGTHALSLDLHFGAALPDAALDHASRRMAQPLVTFDRTDGMHRPSEALAGQIAPAEPPS